MKKKIPTSLEITILNTIKDDYTTWITFYVSKQIYKGTNFFINNSYFTASNGMALKSAGYPQAANGQDFLYVQGSSPEFDHIPLIVNKLSFKKIQIAIKEYNKTIVELLIKNAKNAKNANKSTNETNETDEDEEFVSKILRIKKIHSYPIKNILGKGKENIEQIAFVITKQSHTSVNFSNQTRQEKQKILQKIKQLSKDKAAKAFMKTLEKELQVAGSTEFWATNGVMLRSQTSPQIYAPHASNNLVFLYVHGSDITPTEPILYTTSVMYPKIQKAIKEYNKFHKNISLFPILEFSNNLSPLSPLKPIQKHVIHLSYQKLKTLQDLTELKELSQKELHAVQNDDDTMNTNEFGQPLDSDGEPIYHDTSKSEQGDTVWDYENMVEDLMSGAENSENSENSETIPYQILISEETKKVIADMPNIHTPPTPNAKDAKYTVKPLNPDNTDNTDNPDNPDNSKKILAIFK